MQKDSLIRLAVTGFGLSNLITILFVAIVFAACCTAPPPAGVTGIWDWHCCNGEYFGKMELRESADGYIVGRMFDTTGGGKGRIDGGVTNNYVELTRRWGGRYEQHYTLALSPDGKKLTGAFEGNHVASLGTEFEATRE